MEATKDKTYEGWTNYETWGVALVLDNEQESYNLVRQEAAEYRDPANVHQNVTDGLWTQEQSEIFQLSDFIKNYTEELCGLEDDPGLSLMARQVIQAGLADVNWDEIAENVLSES